LPPLKCPNVTQPLEEGLKGKFRMYLEKEQFGFRRGKGTTDAVGILTIITEQALQIDEELCACYIHW
jgi:hypothetical protein